ncbi:DUF4158 domain-containing protein [Escherichia coli]|uniref:DUF4158 domain-containing protein n=4 Tax=Enterobacterales TaxID=91347 RepID=UPI00225012EB|nr:DUF4158 domain-containing protein [Escherichia coli]MCX3192379.1 DUF4158 domain-containing protein [Escherichia coli]
MIPREVLSFVGAQLGVPADALLTYATRRQTRQQHMDTLREIYGYKTFTGRGARDLREWTFGQAEDARSNEDLAHRFIVRCRETSTILPAVSTIERLCADALVAAERRVACSATISFCESGICHRSGCTYLIPIRPPGSYASW